MGAGLDLEHLIVEHRSAADWVTLNRPEQLNTLNPRPLLDLTRDFAALEDNTSVRVVVLQGAGCAFIKIGLSGCEMGASYHLLRLVGTSVAAELLYTGRFNDAERARRVGLVSEVVAHSEPRQTGPTTPSSRKKDL